MPEATFQPLLSGSLPAAEGRGKTRLKVIPAAEAAVLFEPATPQNHASAGQVRSKDSVHSEHGSPAVTVEREGDLITHIRVQCACGQVTELKCQY